MRRRSKAWKIERDRDPYRKRAEKEGYRSRSAYKLLEATSKKTLIKKGYRVLDLGAAPGGWLQVACEKSGPNGLVIGVDKNPIMPLKTKNVKIIIMDVNDPQLPQIISNISKGKLHTVLSDLSPNISGVWEIDSAVQIDLAETALKIALKTLRPKGGMFVKLFQSPHVRGYYEQVKNYFSTVSYFKPKASKPKSSEIYILANGLMLRY